MHGIEEIDGKKFRMVARLTLHHVAKMSADEVEDLCRWLEAELTFVREHHDELSVRFVGKFYLEVEE